jgi:hypothetical protein
VNWENLNEQPRLSPATLRTQSSTIPVEPGVYALYRHGVPQYVGKANSLKRRLNNDHLRTGVSMTGSALRRNVAMMLGIAPASDIKRGDYVPTAEDAEAVTEWIDGCEFAWWVCASDREACELEERLKRDDMPPLTRR